MGKRYADDITVQELVRLRVEIERFREERSLLREALRIAEAALADIGDADREEGDDLAWCENRAARVLPKVRAALKGDE